MCAVGMEAAISAHLVGPAGEMPAAFAQNTAQKQTNSQANPMALMPATWARRCTVPRKELVSPEPKAHGGALTSPRDQVGLGERGEGCVCVRAHMY